MSDNTQRESIPETRPAMGFDPIASLSADPLSESSRRDRRFMLGLTVIALIHFKTGIFPKSLPALGIGEGDLDAPLLSIVLLIVLSYSVISFSISCVSDLQPIFFVRKRLRWFLEERIDLDVEAGLLFRGHVTRRNDPNMGKGGLLRDAIIRARRAQSIRITLNIIVSLLVAVVAIVLLCCKVF